MAKEIDPGRRLAAILQRWPKTVHQAREWLRDHEVQEEDETRIVENLSSAGFLDDEAYARLFVEGHEGWGPLRLRQELKRRGIPDLLAAEAVAGTQENVRMEEMIEDWRKTGIEDRKIAGRLIRRGFPRGEVMEALRSSCPGWE